VEAEIMTTVEDEKQVDKKSVVSVRVSSVSHKKATQLERFQKFSTANKVWGKDQKLLRCNLLLVPTSKNYTVLLAMGKNKAHKTS
jgi:hypothetical protein